VPIEGDGIPKHCEAVFGNKRVESYFNNEAKRLEL
jgi:hypothetical protein